LPPKKSATPEEQTIVIPGIEVETFLLPIVGDSPLICHRWSEKAKAEMLAKQRKQAKQGKEAKDPERDFLESLYVVDGEAKVDHNTDPPSAALATFGFPCVAFKSSAVGACRYVDGAKMTEARGAFHVIGEFATLDGIPFMREDMVRVGMGTADIRYRGEFREWSTELLIRFNRRAMSREQIVNLFNVAGFGVGIGEWRPEKDGSYGMFHVA